EPLRTGRDALAPHRTVRRSAHLSVRSGGVVTVQDPATVADAEIITALPIPLAVAGHHQPAPFYVTADMFGGLPVQLAGGELSTLVGKPVAAPHVHDVDELYL